MRVATPEKIDEWLSVRGEELYIEECSVPGLAEKYGTPLYVASETALRSNFRRFHRAFQERWPEGKVHVLPSLKANSSLALRAILTQEGAGCDTFGPGELYAALASGVDPGLISVNGSSKDRPLIETALRAGARITLDSLRELELVRQTARDLGTRARIRFRVRPVYAELTQPTDFVESPTPIRDAAQEYKAGIPTEDLVSLGAGSLAAAELDVTGLMVHLGRHSTDLQVWRSMVRSFVDLLAGLSKAWGGWEPTEIDLGGGFATRRDPTGRRSARGRSRAADATAPSIEEYAETLTSTLRSSLAGRGISARDKILEVEPGRSLYADTGIHLATVRNVKRQGLPVEHRWVETDTTEMFLLDGLVEQNAWVPILASHAQRIPEQWLDITGISCGFDVIAPHVRFPRADPGDVIAFLDTGAYQEACANNFNALPRPATVLVRGTDSEIVRRRETVQDVFRRDIVPARLSSWTRSPEIPR
jgi:diaminopimelate decarboxylase